ncbi:MAG: hypothetical protein IBJ00_00445 [Alphaproteobacteria bacterium]|nr:hypothetical protein [Alphaproteobacteria bacterium]
MNELITVYLIGIAGVGKYSIAQEIGKFGYKVVDNHLINNPIFSLIDWDSNKPIPLDVWAAIDQVRDIIFDFIASNTHSNFVFTNELLEIDYDRKVYDKVKNLAEKRGSLFIPVRITASQDVHAKRITTQSRVKRFKTTNVEHIKKHNQLINIQHKNLLHIDTTNLSAEQAALHIMSFIKNLNKKP